MAKRIGINTAVENPERHYKEVSVTVDVQIHIFRRKARSRAINPLLHLSKSRFVFPDDFNCERERGPFFDVSGCLDWLRPRAFSGRLLLSALQGFTRICNRDASDFGKRRERMNVAAICTHDVLGANSAN